MTEAPKKRYYKTVYVKLTPEEMSEIGQMLLCGTCESASKRFTKKINVRLTQRVMEQRKKTAL